LNATAQCKKCQKAMVYVLSKSEAQLKDGLHKTTRYFVDWCLENQAKEVIVGDVEGIQRNIANNLLKNNSVNFGTLSSTK
jgi:hypothetical protein